MKTKDFNTMENSCCGNTDEKKSMCNCLPDRQSGNSDEKMPNCFKGAKWFLAIMTILIISALGFGYILEAEVVRILWIALFGIIFIFGLTGSIFMRTMVKKMTK